MQGFLTYLQAASNGALGLFGNAVYDPDDLNNTYRTQISVKYTVPVFRGLTVEALYGLGAPGAVAGNRTWSGCPVCSSRARRRRPSPRKTGAFSLRQAIFSIAVGQVQRVATACAGIAGAPCRTILRQAASGGFRWLRCRLSAAARTSMSDADQPFPMVAKLIPGAQCYSFEDAGRSPYFETPNEFNHVAGEIVARFAK